MDAGEGGDAGAVTPPEGYALISAGQFMMGAPETELGRKPQGPCSPGKRCPVISFSR